MKGDDIFIANIAIGMRRNKRRTTREFKIDVQNATNNKALVNQYYLSSNEKVYKGKQLPLFPTISYTFSF